MTKPLILTLMGATASGKTKLAMMLCDHLPIEIISVDSAMIYRQMNIGTAKPTMQELTNYPHQLIDIIDPSQSYSAADFRADAIKAIDKALNQNKIPLLVGGTMLYFKALLDGLSPLPTADQNIRSFIEQKAKKLGWPALHKELAKVDKHTAERLSPNDSQRINRALEVYMISGKSMTELTQQKQPALNYDVEQYAVNSENRAQLHQNIATRFMAMLEQGFEQEVIKLMQRGDLHLDLPSMRCVGYRQMWQYLLGEYNYDELIFKGICASRQLAKRQITWLRGWSHPLNYINANEPLAFINTVKKRI